MKPYTRKTQKADSINAMGLKNYLDTHFSYRGTKYLGGYTTYVDAVMSGQTDTTIAEHYHKSRQAVSRWREKYLEEQAANHLTD